ncbi:glycosyltransferase family protein [Microbulbifer sp. 2201CG32-9]|uniref:hypothetical protein n=1 Tax=Microbulbifer sp. 2201CG32-9 TaxID=3232309 RepID=UPI00345BE551
MLIMKKEDFRFLSWSFSKFKKFIRLILKPKKFIELLFDTVNFRRATTTRINQAVLDKSITRKQLLNIAIHHCSIRDKIFIVKHLFRLRNFSSATKIAETISPDSLLPADLFLIIRTQLHSNKGINSDSLLKAFLANHKIQSLNETNQKTLSELIRLSGINYEDKLKHLTVLQAYSTSDKARQHARYQEFHLLVSLGMEVDVIKYSEIDNLSLDNPSYQLRYIPHLKAMGFLSEADSLLKKLINYHQLSRPEIICAALNFNLDWANIDLHKLPESHLDRLDILQIATENKKHSIQFSNLFERSLKAIIKSFPEKNIYQKDKILNKLLRLDLIETVEAFVKNENFLSDTLLTPNLVFGYRALESDDFYSARDLFLEVINEDPSDPIASQGLRLAIPRTGAGITSILNLRNRIGHGIDGHGRTGCRGGVGVDRTFGLLMSGQFYKEGFYSKRHAPHWIMLKRIYGSRFLNCERLPTNSSNKTLFLICDDGVGDEVRTAQFYKQLSKQFGKVIATCDPRLTTLFERSFPEITFVPVERYRKGVIKKVTTDKERISRLNLKLSQYLTEDCQELMNNADYITNGQNIFFNHFIGEIDRPSEGAYIKTKFELSKTKKFKIGILWRSHFLAMWRKFMYLSVENFEPLTLFHNIEIWSMQHCMSEQEKDYCRKHNIKLVEDIDMFDDFEGMAPVLKNLDLMIGISSLPMELAAALGTPVWMLGFSPENFYLRSAGGTTELDQLTLNSNIIAPKWIDFSAPTSECISATISEACLRLEKLQLS